MAVLRGKPFLVTWTRATNELKTYELNASNVFIQSAVLSLPSTYVPDTDNFKNWHFYFSDYSDVFTVHGSSASGGPFPYRLISRAGQVIATNNNAFQRTVTARRRQLYSSISKDLFTWYPDATSVNYPFVNTEISIAQRTQLTYNQASNTSYSDDTIAALAPDDSKIFLFTPTYSGITASKFNSYNANGQLIMSTSQAATLRVNPFLNSSYPNGVTYNDAVWAGNDYCIMAGQANNQDVGLIAIVYNFKDPNLTTELNGRAEDVYSMIETLGQAKRIAAHPNSKLVAIGFKTLAGVYRTGVYRRTGKYLQRLSVIENFGAELSFTKDGRFLIDAVLGKAYNYVGNNTFEENTTMMANVSAATYQGISLHSDTLAITEQYDFLLKVANQDVSFTNLKALFLSSAASFDATDITVNEVTNNGAYVVTDPTIPVDGVPLSSTLVSNVGGVKLNVNDLTINPQNAMTVAKILIYDDVTDTPLNLIDLTRDVLIDKNTPFQLAFENGLQYYVAQ